MAHFLAQRISFSRIALLLVSAFFLVGNVMAATQGYLGSSSTASFLVSVSIPVNFKISGMDDFTFGQYSGSGNVSSNKDVCIYTNSYGSYSATITDSSTMSPSGFSVQNATASYAIDYGVKWNDRRGTSGNETVYYNSQTDSRNANTQSMDCSIGGDSANLQITFSRHKLQAAPGGYYSTVLTVMIEP